jgi:hypothetical protein
MRHVAARQDRIVLKVTLQFKRRPARPGGPPARRSAGPHRAAPRRAPSGRPGSALPDELLLALLA